MLLHPVCVFQGLFDHICSLFLSFWDKNILYLNVQESHFGGIVNTQEKHLYMQQMHAQKPHPDAFKVTQLVPLQSAFIFIALFVLFL